MAKKICTCPHGSVLVEINGKKKWVSDADDEKESPRGKAKAGKGKTAKPEKKGFLASLFDGDDDEETEDDETETE